MLCEIISGFSDGAELAALEVARENGFITGGSYSDNLDEAQKRQAKNFNLILDRQPERLRRNVADATLLFTGRPNSPETDEVRRLYASKIETLKQIIIVEMTQTATSVAEWLHENRVRVLNVVGDTEAKSPGIKDFAKTFLYDVIHKLFELDGAGGERQRTPIWRNRMQRRHRNEVPSNSYSQFIDHPSEQTLEPLSNIVDSWIWDVFFNWLKGRRVIPVTNKYAYMRRCIETHGYIMDHLRRYMSREIASDQLLDGFRSEYNYDEFEVYVTAATYFHLWKGALCDSDQQSFRRQVRECFSPHLKEYVRSRFRSYPDKIQALALDKFFTENDLYMERGQHFATLDSIRRSFEWRIKKRLKNASNSRVNREFLTQETDLNHRVGLSGNLSPEGLRDLDRLDEQSRNDAEKVASTLFDIACQTTANYPRQQGRRLFLLMMLGGLSHTRRCSLRDSERSRYLVQEELIDMFLYQNPNFIQHWFRRFFNRKMDPRDIFSELIRRLDPDLSSFPLGLGDRFPLANHIDGWGIFVKVCNTTAENIKKGYLVPDAEGIRPVDWASQFDEILGAHGLQGYESNRFDPRQIELAKFTKFVIQQVKVPKEDGWRARFDEFAQIRTRER